MQPTAAGAAAPSDTGPLTLHAVDAKELGDGFVAFPDAARPPMNQSPGFRWTGVPIEAKSLALVFRDVSSPVPPVKWVLWNMPPDRTEIPANVSGNAAMPAMVPSASQLGSLGNQGYAGPCCVGNEYEWILYALDVAELPGTERLSTAQINMNIIPMHTLEKSDPVMMRIDN
jgi:Raf kinase inhibitor-like YbhB/YbcL family protein